MQQRRYLTLAGIVLVLVPPSKLILTSHLSKNLKKSKFEVCVSDLLYSQYYQTLNNRECLIIIISTVCLFLPVFSPIFRFWLCNHSMPGLWRLTVLDVRLRI